MNWFKKSVSLILIFTVFISAFIYNSAPAVSAASVTTMHVTGTDVTVRKGAGTNYEKIDTISQRTVTVINTTPTQDAQKKYEWYNISYYNGTKTITGWIAYSEEWIGGIYTYNPDADFETQISAFPESYRDALRKLHAQYPNWKFIPDPVGKSFNSAIAEQMKNNRKLVQMSQTVSWRSMGLGAYDWNKGKWEEPYDGWTGASREVIAYYMDPRNFLNSSEIYMFMEQSYNSNTQNREGVKKIIAGTFMEKNYTPVTGEPGGGSYLEAIMLAAETSKVSPYVIAAKIRQEQGTCIENGNILLNDLISGTYSGYNGIYKGYYNFFNIKATGSNVIKNGLEYAKKVIDATGKVAWNTRYKSILGGAQFLANGYISKGQNTSYYQDFNVHNGGTHQYAEAVHDAYNQGLSLAKTYQSDKDFSLSFIIPIYTDMPSAASPMPAKSDKRNNYYLSEITVEGLTPSFGMYTHSYNLAVSGDTTVKVNAVSGAVIVANSSISLKAGENEVTILARAETGYRSKYTIHINASKACTLYIKSAGATMEAPSPSDSSSSNNSGSSSSNNSNSSSNTSSGTSSNPLEQVVMLGDTNSDGKITIIDLAKVQMHLLKVKNLSGASLTAGDVNKDGKISIVDLAKIQMHILKVKIIEQ